MIKLYHMLGGQLHLLQNVAISSSGTNSRRPSAAIVRSMTSNTTRYNLHSRSFKSRPTNVLALKRRLTIDVTLGLLQPIGFRFLPQIPLDDTVNMGLILQEAEVLQIVVASIHLQQQRSGGDLTGVGDSFIEKLGHPILTVYTLL